ncbi:hypothetical protein GQ43DRAFT_268460 [Delitschia confertaspora ATCC 74209]|uniref:Uncharacterized protein n=1 Tax=Delitschia confertaspora ATCC 74209 TaxID=1513339 RepID=A0A9P4JDD8_9PLEO|nr:hypothetical protein GQ43DRAFT_268460 [Delitschia confertaspora ATCC 74209]
MDEMYVIAHTHTRLQPPLLFEKSSLNPTSFSNRNYHIQHRGSNCRGSQQCGTIEESLMGGVDRMMLGI